MFNQDALVNLDPPQQVRNFQIWISDLPNRLHAAFSPNFWFLTADYNSDVFASSVTFEAGPNSDEHNLVYFKPGN